MITVLGSITVDLVGTVPSLPSPGETVLGSQFMATPGGKGANQALAAARAGARVRMIGATGADPYAVQALELLSAGGVDLSGVHQLEAATGVAFVIVDAAGENQIAVMSGANLALTTDTIGELAFVPEDVLLMQLEVPVAAMAPALLEARKAGATTLVNLAPFSVDGLPLAQQADVLIVNEGECKALGHALGVSPVSVRETAASVKQIFGNTVILTLGSEGSMAFTPTETLVAHAPRINAIDTVGAGDTFCGYLAAGIARTQGALDLDLLQLATNAASMACQRRGAQAAIPMLADIK